MEACHELAVFGGTGADVYALVEEVGSSCVDCIIWFGLSVNRWKERESIRCANSE